MNNSPENPDNGEKNTKTQTEILPAGINVPDTQSIQNTEAKEQEPQLDLIVYGPCKNQSGNYIGLNQGQRIKLKVAEGGTVELFGEQNKSLGFFTVGKGSKEIVNNPDQFTVNNLNPDQKIIVKKVSENNETVLSLKVTHGIESTPTHLQDEDAQKYSQRTQTRSDKISTRFPEIPGDEFITVPTSIVNLQLGSSEKVAPISKLPVRYAGKTIEIAIVPAGNDIGFTTKAAEKLEIPSQLTELRIRVDKGVLVID